VKLEFVDPERVSREPPQYRNGHADAAPSHTITTLEPVDLDGFLRLKLPLRDVLFTPWLPEAGLAMMYAPRGVGKTHLALNIGYAVAAGGEFLKWRAPKPQPVLYIDGEMSATELQARLLKIAARSLNQPPESGLFRMLAADLQRDGLPDIADIDQQSRYDDVIADAKLIIVDNLSTLCRSGRENESESWLTVQSWALRQRRAGRSVLFIHHAGKSGGQRGTSRKEDVLDTVIGLRRPEDYRAEEGCRVEVHFEKARGFTGPNAEPFEAALQADGSWTIRSTENVLEAKILALAADGLSQRDIAAEVGKSLGTVNAVLKRSKSAQPSVQPFKTETIEQLNAAKVTAGAHAYRRAKWGDCEIEQ
jgi:hypothetical protein